MTQLDVFVHVGVVEHCSFLRSIFAHCQHKARTPARSSTDRGPRPDINTMNNEYAVSLCPHRPFILQVPEYLPPSSTLMLFTRARFYLHHIYH